jgi:hypothetical protein
MTVELVLKVALLLNQPVNFCALSGLVQTART